jgi:drug/metabolite transporter (DMT)-like permease
VAAVVSTSSARRTGVLLCLISAAGFGTLAILGKEAYRSDVGVMTLLAVRFSLAAALLWVIVWRRRPPRPARRSIVAGVGLGLAGYSAQSGLFFGALTRIDASLAALLLYAYPGLVVVGAVLLGRERADRRRVVGLVVASAGVVLVLGGGGGDPDAVGVTLALGAAVAYTGYILTSDALVGDVAPVMLAALVCSGAATTFTVLGLASGRLDLAVEPRGWAILAVTALVSTVGSILTFFAGLARVGPSTASILSTVEPPVTVGLAVLVLDERLTIAQAIGSVGILGAVALLAIPVRGRELPAD